MAVNLRAYLPSIYTGDGGSGVSVLETDTIAGIEDGLFDNAWADFDLLKNNQFVVLADAGGIANYEKMLGIVADPGLEDLEFRRQRVINRMSMQPPFTFRFLKNRLDALIGAGRWEAYIDFDSYTLYVESAAANQNWYNELHITIGKVKPANIVFINIPLYVSGVGLNTTVTASEVQWNYRAGTTAFASDETPLASMNDIGVIKMADVSSVQPAFLNLLAGASSDAVAQVVVNDALTITDLTKTVTDNVLQIEFDISEGAGGIDVITNIKLQTADGTILDSSPCSVPLLGDLRPKFRIPVVEVLD